MILISNDFWHKIQMYNCDPYTVLLSIAAAYDCVCDTFSNIQISINIIFFCVFIKTDLSPNTITNAIINHQLLTIKTIKNGFLKCVLGHIPIYWF